MVPADIWNWIYTWSVNAGSSFLRIAIIIVGAWLALRFFRVFINKVFYGRWRREGAEQRLQTLSTLLQSVSRYVVYFVAGIMVLDEFGVRTSSLIAGAGIIGLAVGFGAQNLVKDVISGFFIVFENQYVVGDYIQAGGVSGIVEELGLRMTKLRDWGGEVHIIPNGEITKVTNHTRGSMRALVDVTVAYEEQLDRVIKITREEVEGLAREMPTITEGPTVLGIDSMDQAGVTLRIVAKTQPMEQWAVEREIRRRLKEAFEREGVAFAARRVIINQSGRGDGAGQQKDT